VLPKELIDMEDPIVRALLGRPKLMFDGSLVTAWKASGVGYEWRMQDYVPPAFRDLLAKSSSSRKEIDKTVYLKEVYARASANCDAVS
jgi:hypothetical protein